MDKTTPLFSRVGFSQVLLFDLVEIDIHVTGVLNKTIERNGYFFEIKILERLELLSYDSIEIASRAGEILHIISSRPVDKTARRRRSYILAQNGGRKLENS